LPKPIKGRKPWLLSRQEIGAFFIDIPGKSPFEWKKEGEKEGMRIAFFASSL
jgi:hypothetical protein